MKIKLQFVQILRGFAAIAVLLFHLDGESRNFFRLEFFNFGYGYLGVDFFFALSGFIITYNHFKDIEQKGSVKKFFIKRFIRIYPIYWFIFLLVILIKAPEFTDKPILSVILDPSKLSGWIAILKNIFLIPLPFEHLPVGVAWSLIYEIAFYAVFGLFITIGWKGTKYILFAWLCLILLNSRDIFPKNIWTEVFTGNLIIEFILGCVVGYLVLKGRELKGYWLIAGLSGITLFFLAYLSWHPFNRYSIAITLLMGAASSIIIFYAATLDKNNKYRILAIPLLILIGDASYSIYLSHNLFSYYIFRMVNEIINTSALSIWAIYILNLSIFVMIITASILLHLLVEKPMLKFLRKKLLPHSNKPITQTTT